MVASRASSYPGPGIVSAAEGFAAILDAMQPQVQVVEEWFHDFSGPECPTNVQEDSNQDCEQATEL